MGLVGETKTEKDTDAVKTSGEKTLLGKSVWERMGRLLLVFGLLYSIYSVGTRTIAYLYSRQAPPTGLHKAITLNPGNPLYYSALGIFLAGSLRETGPEEVIVLFQKATQLSPQKARYWAELGSAYEWAGREEEALLAFVHARDLFPHSPDINWWL